MATRLPPAVLWLLTAGAMVANLSQTLDALANRGAGKNAEAAKVAATVRTDRAALKRLSDERQGMRFTAADADAVRAAQAAVSSAEAIRVRECGNGDPRSSGAQTAGRVRAEEQAKRDTLATVLANKALTDQAAKLDAEIARVTARLDKAPPVRETHSGNLFASIFSLSPIAAASYQQQIFAALIEAIIAASLCLPELLTPRRSFAVKRQEKTTGPQGAIDVTATPAKGETRAPIALPKPQLVSDETPAASIITFAGRALERSKGARVEFEEFYLAYATAALADSARALPPADAIGPTQRLCAECNIPIKSIGSHKYLMGVRLKQQSKSERGLGHMHRRPPAGESA